MSHDRFDGHNKNIRPFLILTTKTVKVLIKELNRFQVSIIKDKYKIKDYKKKENSDEVITSRKVATRTRTNREGLSTPNYDRKP